VRRGLKKGNLTVGGRTEEVEGKSELSKDS
jgi:hypothetical protein